MFFIDCLESADPIARRLCKETKAAVVSVE